MQRILAASLIAAACVPLTAQVSAPKGYENTPGDHHTTFLGMYSTGRYQYADGTLRGTNLAVRRVSYRLDQGHAYSAKDGTGRTWTNVQLTMAHTDVARMTNTWTANLLTTTNGAPSDPTQVFNSKVTWGTVSGFVASAPWGSHVDFPFSRTWVYVAKSHDILFDFQFRTGTLASTAAWAGRLRSFYYLDGVGMGAEVDAPGNWWPGDPVGGSCNDSAHNVMNDAHTGVGAVIYADDHPTVSLRGQLKVRLWSYWTAPGRPVLQVLGVAGKRGGVPVGAVCNKLHVDLAMPALLFPRTAGGIAGFSGTATFGPAPYQNALAGLQLWAQSAWTDSKTAAFSLTAASEITLPRKPTTLPKKMLQISSVTSLVGTGPETHGTAQSLPLLSAK